MDASMQRPRVLVLVVVLLLAVSAVLILSSSKDDSQALAGQATRSGSRLVKSSPVLKNSEESNGPSCQDEGRNDPSIVEFTKVISSLGKERFIADYCSDDGSFVNEVTCGFGADTDQTDTLPQICEYGCMEGRCINFEEAAVASCTDSSDDMYLADMVTYTLQGDLTVFSLEDTCVDSSGLAEATCSGNIADTQFEYCEYGCVNGACLNPTCMDSDAESGSFAQQKMIAGTASGLFGTTGRQVREFQDSCTSDGRVLEYFCAGSDAGRYVGTIAQTCDVGYSCVDGACVST